MATKHEDIVMVTPFGLGDDVEGCAILLDGVHIQGSNGCAGGDGGQQSVADFLGHAN